MRRMTGIIWIFDHDETFGMDASSQLHRFAIEELCDRHHLIFPSNQFCFEGLRAAQSTVTVMLSLAAPPKLEGATKGVSAVGGNQLRTNQAPPSGLPLPDLKGYLEKPPTESFKLEPRGAAICCIRTSAGTSIWFRRVSLMSFRGTRIRIKRSGDRKMFSSPKAKMVAARELTAKMLITSLAPDKEAERSINRKNEGNNIQSKRVRSASPLKGCEGGVRFGDIELCPSGRGGASMTQERSGKYQARMIIRAASSAIVWAL